MALVYRYAIEELPTVRARVKVEINTREHSAVLGPRSLPFEVRSRWFDGAADVSTFAVEELLGTKLRALYQRKKGRDLFDLWQALRRGSGQPDRIVECFTHYTHEGGTRITRAMFERNLTEKRSDPVFTADLRPLLAHDVEWDFEAAFALVWDELVNRLPGEPWKSA